MAGFLAGAITIAILFSFVTKPLVYANGVKDCMNGKAVVTITSDTLIHRP